MPLDQKALQRLLKRGVAEVIEEAELLRLLRGGGPSPLKRGFDHSRPDIHLGHCVGLRKLRQFQELGHQVVLIVGDWTARIGDPSGQSATRPMLTPEEVKENAETYLRQFFRIVDRERTQIVWQSEWFGKFGLADVIRLASRFTVAFLLQREDFKKRWEEERPIALTELVYPLLQAYDSVAVQADVEFGGTDQKFNLLVGRRLQEMEGQRPQQCFLVPLLAGTDGVHKMSKSLDNYIGVEEPPREMYGKVMSIPDPLILPYFDLLTDVPDEDLGEMGQALKKGGVNPMDLKKRLGREIVAQFWGQEAVREAEEWFEKVYQKREVPEGGIREVVVSDVGRGYDEAFVTKAREVEIIPFLIEHGLASSKSEAKRLLRQGAIEVDGKRVAEEKVLIPDGAVLRVGKHQFLRVRLGS